MSFAYGNKDGTVSAFSSKCIDWQPRRYSFSSWLSSRESSVRIILRFWKLPSSLHPLYPLFASYFFYETFLFKKNKCPFSHSKWPFLFEWKFPLLSYGLKTFKDVKISIQRVSQYFPKLVEQFLRFSHFALKRFV